jgi:peroxiredoxin
MSARPHPAPEDDGAADHLAPGLALPDMALVATVADRVNPSKLRGSAVLFVYPWTGRPGVADPPGWDDIPGAHGSTPETLGFRDRYRDFQALGIEVFGLSSQSGEHHRELAARLDVPFPLLSDEAFAFAGALRLPTFTAGAARYLKRLTLIVRDGRIGHVFYPVHPPGDHAREVLDWLARSGRAAD